MSSICLLAVKNRFIRKFNYNEQIPSPIELFNYCFNYN